MVSMLKRVKYFAIATFLVLASASASFAQCNGQFTAGQLCGNATVSQAPPTGVGISTFLDSQYGTVAGTILYRGPSGWTSLPGNNSGTTVLSENASGVPSWIVASGTGTVTSVGLSLPGIFTVSGSPVTTTGTLTATLASQSQNLVWASPNGSSGAPTFRTIVLGDFASISANTVVGNGTGSGSAPTALSVPSCSTATSALTWTSGTGFGCNSITGTGTVTSIVIGTGLASTQSPLTTTGTLSLATISADNLLGNATGGTAAPVAVPLTSCSAAQNALTYNTSTHAFGCNLISGSGTVVASSAGQIAWYSISTNVVVGSLNANLSNGALTLGQANTVQGQVILEGGTSGALTITTQAAASTPTWTAGTSSGTPVVTASSPLSITTATGNITITGAAGKVLAGSGPTFTATPTIGVAATTTGSLSFVGLTSGTVVLSVQDIAGSWTFKLPTSGGSNGEFLQTDGSGNATWASPSGSGTVNSGTAGQLAYYASSTTAVSGNANANISAGALTLGQANTTQGQVVLEGSTSGALTITTQATAGTPTWTAGTSSGTPVVTASAPLSITTATGNIVITGAAGQVLAGSGPAFTATPTLGASGTVGTIAFGNATSGTVTLGTVTGALGSVTAQLPANSGIIAELNLAQTWSAVQTFTNSDIRLLGSSTGYTTFTSGNSSGTNYTATLPANTGTIAELNLAQSWTAAQTFTNSDILLLGSSTGATTFTSANAGASNFTLTFPAVTDTIAVLGTADQTLSGGANVTAYSIGSVSSGTTTIDCGKNPQQWMVDTGASTIASPTSDGSCTITVINGNNAGTISTSGFPKVTGTYSTATTASATVTFTNSSANIGWTANGLLLNQPVYFTTTGGLPTNFTTGTIYYVSTTGTNTIQVSATPGGSGIVAGSAGTGTQTGIEPSVYDFVIIRTNGLATATWVQAQ